MHVVIYTDTPTFGGAESVARLIVANLDERVRVTVVGPCEFAVAAIAEGRDSVQFIVSKRLEGKGDLSGARAIRRLFRSLRPDVIHFNLTDMAACLTEIAVASTLSGVALVAVQHSGYLPQTRFQRIALVISARILQAQVAVSQPLAAQVAAIGRVPIERVTVVHNGVARVTEKPRPTLSKLLQIGVVTRLTEDKGIDVLIEALRDLPDVELHVAGDGEARGVLFEQALASGVAERVHFHGWLGDPSQIYRTIDVLVHPSRADIMPLSVIEAMHHGLPVIASNVGSLPEIVQDGVTGLLVTPGDVGALLRAIEELHVDPARRARLGAAGRQRAVDEFDVSTMVAGYSRVYDRACLLAGRRRWRRARFAFFA